MRESKRKRSNIKKICIYQRKYDLPFVKTVIGFSKMNIEWCEGIRECECFFFDKWAQLLQFSSMVIRLTNIWRIFVSDWTNAYTINNIRSFNDDINGSQRFTDEIRNKNYFVDATNYTWLPMNANNKLITNHFSLFCLNLLSVAFYRRFFFLHSCSYIEQMDFVNDANDDQC